MSTGNVRYYNNINIRTRARACIVKKDVSRMASRVDDAAKIMADEYLKKVREMRRVSAEKDERSAGNNDASDSMWSAADLKREFEQKVADYVVGSDPKADARPVLINLRFGGFGITKDFEDFVLGRLENGLRKMISSRNDDCENDDDELDERSLFCHFSDAKVRCTLAEEIPTFGALMASRYPDTFRTVQAYVILDMSRADTEGLHALKKEMDTSEMNRNTLRRLLDNGGDYLATGCLKGSVTRPSYSSRSGKSDTISNDGRVRFGDALLEEVNEMNRFESSSFACQTADKLGVDMSVFLYDLRDRDLWGLLKYREDQIKVLIDERIPMFQRELAGRMESVESLFIRDSVMAKRGSIELARAYVEEEKVVSEYDLYSTLLKEEGEEAAYSSSMDAIKFARETTNHLRAWRTFSRFASKPIRFLHRVILASGDDVAYRDLKSALSSLERSVLPEERARAEKVFGLELAGTKSSRLYIEHVPSIMGWTLGEYDGKEGIRYDWARNDRERGCVSDGFESLCVD